MNAKMDAYIVEEAVYAAAARYSPTAIDILRFGAT
jgi:hypothetical protein